MTELEVLGRRAVAARRWRWLPGTLAIVPPASDGSTGYLNRITEGTGPVNSSRAYPDLSDPATLGCLLALVREAWGKPDLHTRPEGSRWRMWSFEWPSSMLHPTEAEALVAALEAAP